MGGQGSGRHHYIGARDTTDEYRQLDVRCFQREGLLTPGLSFCCQWSYRRGIIASIGVRVELDRIILTYRYQSAGQERQDKEYFVLIDWMDCNYGGKRAWFRCPVAGCGRRVAILYGGSIFACRCCHRLVYQSQRENMIDRKAGKAGKIRKRLKWQAGILNHTGHKPKGMRWKTYWRLHSEHHNLSQAAFALMLQSLGLESKR